MKQNQIQVKNVKTGRPSIFTIKGNKVYDNGGRNPVYCGCTGKTVETATPMLWDGEKVYCPNCHEKKVEIIQTYNEWKTEQDEKDRKRNEERLANLHLVERGSDWECGIKYYGLSANIEYDDWLKVKEHFRYYRRGWSRGQELEWNYGEPSGWLTRTPKVVEDILVDEGLIKSENTMESIRERKELEEERKQNEERESRIKRQEIKSKMDEIDSEIKKCFDDSAKKRVLSDAEANLHYFNADFGRGNVCTYRIVDGEIVKCDNMGDFKYGVAVPFSEKLKQLIENFYSYNRMSFH